MRKITTDSLDWFWKKGVKPIKEKVENLKNTMDTMLKISEIVNNCVTDNPDLPLAAAQGKFLMDQITGLYSDMDTAVPCAVTFLSGNSGEIIGHKIGHIVMLHGWFTVPTPLNADVTIGTLPYTPIENGRNQYFLCDIDRSTLGAVAFTSNVLICHCSKTGTARVSLSYICI